MGLLTSRSEMRTLSSDLLEKFSSCKFNIKYKMVGSEGRRGKEFLLLAMPLIIICLLVYLHEKNTSYRLRGPTLVCKLYLDK
jgi:hypothetical protein